MLYYEANGFWLFTRRLENGKFKFKRHEESGVLMITPQQLNWLIERLEFGGFNSDLDLNPVQNDMLNQMNHMNDINHMNDMHNFNNF